VLNSNESVHACVCVCVCLDMCHAIQDRAGVTDEIRIVGTLSAFDWLDIAGWDTKKQIIADDSPPSWKRRKKAAGTKEKEEAGNHVTSNLLIFSSKKEVGVLSGQGGCGNEIYCKWEKTPTRDRSLQMETLLNQDKLQMGLNFYSQRK